MIEKKFIPVKVTDREWAEKLLDGEVFMRPLYEFGGWNLKNRTSQLNNSFRGDISEGTTAVFADVEDCPLAKDLKSAFGDLIKRVSYIDDTDIKYFKIFSLYCMEYDPIHNFFVRPDSRMRKFGDTAVIITDYNEFIDRYAKALFKRYDPVVSMIDRVSFYDFKNTKRIHPLFGKHQKFEYQNELRMAFCELEKNEFAMGPDADSALKIVEDASPVKLQLGSIRDIAYAVPIDNFLKLLIPRYIPLHFPMRELYQVPSNYDVIVAETRKAMKDYKSIFIKPMITIG